MPSISELTIILAVSAVYVAISGWVIKGFEEGQGRAMTFGQALTTTLLWPFWLLVGFLLIVFKPKKE